MANTAFSAVLSVSGTANQIASSGGLNPIEAISNNPIIPGTGGVTVPAGTSAQRAGGAGSIRFNTSLNVTEITNDGASWTAISLGMGLVDSVSGTANRITSTGGVNPVIDISAAYVGQTSITTLGTITTGVWNAGAVTTTQLDVDNIEINGNTISSTDVNGSINLVPNGAGSVTFLTGAPVILTSTAQLAGLSSMSAGNLHILVNLIEATNPNGNINLNPDGTGVVTIGGTATASSEIRFFEMTGSGNNFIGLKAPNALAGDITYILPAVPTVNGQVLSSTIAGVTSWVTASTVTTPTTDNAAARFDGVGGALQNSLVIIDDLGAISGATQLNVDNIQLDANTISATNAGGDILLLANTTGVVEISSNATKAGILRFREPVGSGTNFIALQAPAMAGDTTYQLPNAYPAVAGYVLSSDLTGTMAWVSNASSSWIDQTATPVTMVANGSYSANTAGLLTFNMPAVVTFGSVFEVVGQGAGGWLIQMAAGQTANLNSLSTTIAGSLASTNRYNSVRLVCTVANTTFTVYPSSGNITLA